ncbi:MAG: hypothetical protein M3Q03_00105 [Chloroflexota bacterium]|nr:hypothetical protein [Chloroflexota bacterium]
MSRTRRIRPDTVTLVPASLLPFKQEWQRLARALPPGSTLIVVPAADSPLCRSMQRVAVQLREGGHRVTTVGAAPLKG